MGNRLLGSGKAAFRLRAYVLLAALPALVLLFYEPPLADRVLDFGRALRRDRVAAEELRAIAQDAARPAHERFGAVAEMQRLSPGEAPEDVLLSLHPLLEDEDPAVRAHMAQLLRTSQASDADDVLLERLAGDEDPDVRRTVAAVVASRVLWHAARASETPAARLRAGLERSRAEDPSSRVRHTAGQLLTAFAGR